MTRMNRIYKAKRKFFIRSILLLGLFGLVACTSHTVLVEEYDNELGVMPKVALALTETPVVVTETAVSPTSTVIPTATSIPLTATPTIQPDEQESGLKDEQPFIPTRLPFTLSHEQISRFDVAQPENNVWLTYLNDIRWQAGLPPVSESETITVGAQAHSEYMGRNDNPVARMELSDNPYYSVEGRIAAYRSNIFALSSSGGTDLWAMNFWLSAPFHALGLLDPQLQEVGYGRFRDDLGFVKVASVLDVQTGLTETAPNVTYPIFHPPNGGQSYILRQSLLEYPEPTASCPGYQKPTGPPLIVQLGSGQLQPTATDVHVYIDGIEVEACAFSETTYTNPTDHAQTRGRDLLNWRDAIVIIPRHPIDVGQTVQAQLTANNQQYSWSFTTINPPYIDIESIPLSHPSEIYGNGVYISGFNFGGQTHDLNHPGLMQQTGMTWVKFQLKWRPDSQPEEITARLTQAKALGFNVLVSVTGDAYPTEIDYEAFTEFMSGLAALDTAPDAIEVWNEMNIDFEWPAGSIDPALYVEKMLQPAYVAIKRQDPSIIVISGAPAPTGFDNGTNAWAVSRYITGMAEAGAANYLDCIGVHYNEGATSPYETQGHPAGGYYGWYFLPSMEAVFYTFGGARPLCITELGFLSGEGYDGVPGRFWWASETSDEEQGLWLAEALTLANRTGFVRLAIIFNVDIFHWGVDPQAGFAIVRPGGDCKFCEVVRGQP